MARTRSMTRNKNHDDEEASSSKKRPRTCVPWSNLDHDLLFLVMKRLGVVDILFFSGVCKSWRSLALSHMDTFMASTPPLSITINGSYADEKACFLEDFEGRKFKTTLPWFFAVDDCVGLTCGYLVFFLWEIRDFRLVNPITRHQLRFPDFPGDDNYRPERAILVFSALISKWVFVVLLKYSNVMWFCIVGERAWNHVSYPRVHIIDLYAFKGKIYTFMTSDTPYFNLCEPRLGGQQPELTLLKIKNPDCASLNELVSSGDNFYGIGWDRYCNQNSFYELDLGEMKWVKACEKTLEEYAFFRSKLNHDFVAVKRELWAYPRSWSHGRYAYSHNTLKIKVNIANMWYFPHECMNVDLIDK